MDYRESIFTAISDQDSESARFMAKLSIELMHKQLPNRPVLWEKLTPTYPIGCKRVIVSDDYFPTIGRENVQLETGKIGGITAKGIEVDGKEIEFDLIIFATGFQTTAFFRNSINVTGSAGRSLDSIWSLGPRALYGITAESLPNFAMLYGPNTNLGHNSIVLMIEAQSRYINALIGAVLDARKTGKSFVIAPNLNRLENYNAGIQSVLQRSPYAHPSCSNWYKNDDGTITQNWSGTVIEYQKMLAVVNWDDYDLTGAAADSLRDQHSYLGRVVEETWMSYRTMALTAIIILSVAAGAALRFPMMLRAR